MNRQLFVFALFFAAFSFHLQAQTGCEGLSLDTGIYNNRIAETTPPLPYTEVCFRGGQVLSDVHAANETTLGGNCEPGDIGWIIERDERASMVWDLAKVECLKVGMRLPENFEFKFSCKNAAQFGLANMTGNFEWSSNSVIANISQVPVSATLMGHVNCNTASWAVVADEQSRESTFWFRCAR